MLRHLPKALFALGVEVRLLKLRNHWKMTGVSSWEDPEHIPAVLALIHSEVSEALEAFREDDRDAFADELADVLIRLVGLASGLGIDLGARAIDKNERNKTRPFRHGGKRI